MLRPPHGWLARTRDAAGAQWLAAGAVMEQLNRLLAGLLRAVARLLPPGRREWAEAVRAEAGQVPGGWPRLRWTAGGLWLVTREANVVRKAVYVIGLGAVAVAAAWAVWLTWRASSAVHPQAVTNRVRVLAGVAALTALKARRPDTPADEMVFLAVTAGAIVLVVLPLQMLAIVYVAGISAVTSRRSPVPTASLAAGTLTGLFAGLVICAVMPAIRGIDQLFPAVLIMAVMVSLLLTPAGVAAAWLLPGTGDSRELREARIRQGLLAGVVAGAVGGLLLTVIFPLAVFMMVTGPLFGALFGAFGGAVAADHPRRPRTDGSWAGGLFALSRTR